MIMTTHKNSKYLSQDEYEVQKILDQRKERNKIVYLVKWKDYPHSENTWQPKENLRKATIKLKQWQRRKLKMNLTYDDEEAQVDKDSYNTKGTMSKKTNVKKQKVITKRKKSKYNPTSLELDQYEKKLKNQKRVWEKSQYQSIEDEDEQKVGLYLVKPQKIRNIESADSTKMQNRQEQQILEFGKEVNQQIFNQDSNLIAETSSLHRQVIGQPWMEEVKQNQMVIKKEQEENGSQDRGLQKVTEDRLQLQYSSEKNIRSLSYHGSNSCISQLLQSYCTLSINSPAIQFQNEDGRSNQQQFRQLSALLNQQRFDIEQLSEQINLIEEPIKNNEPDLFDYLKNECGGMINYDNVVRIIKREKESANNIYYFLGEMKNGKMIRLQNYQELKQARPLLLLDYYQKIVGMNLQESVIGFI